MVTYSQLRDMDTSKLSMASSTSGDLSSALATRAGEVRSAAAIPAGMWAASDADAASALLGGQESPLSNASDAFRTGKAALEDLVDGLENAKERLRDAHGLVEGTGVVINSDGSVTTPVVDNPATAAINASLAQQVARLIEDALRLANSADDTAAETIQSASVDTDEDSIPDSRDDSPQDVHDWWNSLSQARRHAYIREHPEQIGGLDGIPAEDRHNANMEMLRHDAEHGDDKKNAQALLDEVEDSQDGPADQRIYLLGYQPPEYEEAPNPLGIGDGYDNPMLEKVGDAKVIAAIGNPDTADHTSVVVPGMGSDLENAPDNIGKAQNLFNASAERGAPGEDISSIMWMDYDAPDDISGAISGDSAQEGGPALRDFSQGLDATNPDSHDTVIGHSYGSSVVGTADAGGEDGLGADNVVAVGSPGMGYDESGDKIDNQDWLHTDQNHVWSGLADDDQIRVSQTFGNHGTLPHEDHFGGTRFSTDDAGGHSEYFHEDTDALENQARIITRQYPVEEYEEPEPREPRFGYPGMPR